MKRILVVTRGSTTEKSLYRQLKRTIGDIVSLQSVSGDEILDNDTVEDYDLLVFSSPDSFSAAGDIESLDYPYIIAERVVDHKKLVEIVALPDQSEVLIVNDSKETAFEAINQLQTLGMDQLSFTPFYPGIRISDFTKFDVALTLGEPQLVPEHFKDFIDLGTRIISIKSIHEILEKLELTNRFKQRLTERYIKDIVDVMKRTEKGRRDLKKSENLLESILNTVEQGIVCMDDNEKISRLNSKMERILSKHSKDILGKSLGEVIGVTSVPELLLESKILEIGGRQYMCVVSRVEDDDIDRYVLTFENINRLRNKDIKLKEFLRGQKHVQMHSFDDYITLNLKNKEMISKAKRFAKTESNILVQGENGTGKEILAQAIHRHSRRREKAFLPINITAISDSLLESELFGYEPGAFTGANKNGKVGIFEKAEGGTVFIDEIGDAPLSIQARLLRVIQEKRIRRVGGHEEIPVDVRIVSATNKDLHQMVRDEAFREDLYFRLNVLPLQTMALRERKEDISHLLNIFLNGFYERNDLSLEKLFSEDVIKNLTDYSWRGNVRELLNFAEFVQAIYDDEPVQIEDLPEYMLREVNQVPSEKLEYIEYKVLCKMSADRFTGRRSITSELVSEGLETSEGQVRGAFKRLENKGFLELIDRKGARLTLRGNDVLRTYIESGVWD